MEDVREILSDAGIKELQTLLINKNCLIALDFDGTLAPIVDNPTNAFPTEDVKKLLVEIQKYRDILIVTGRSIGDVKTRLPEEIRYIIGNHGVEGSPLASEETLEQAKNITREWLTILKERLSSDSKIVIEDKIFSLTLHYRQSHVPNSSKDSIKKEVSYLSPSPIILDGKSIVNILPPGVPDKYVSLSSFMILKNFKHSIYIGDDITDNQVFRANDPRVCCIKIGTNAELAAPWYLKEQEDILLILRIMFEIIKCSG